MAIDILIIGSGSLAEAILFSLVTLEVDKLNLAIVARNEERLNWLHHAASAQAFSVNHNHVVQARLLTRCDTAGVASVLQDFRPTIVLNVASLQSAWTLGGQDGWSRFVSQHGYGVTAPLQLALALEIAKAIRMTLPSALYVNAAYPDVVNSLLLQLGYPVCCGLGNVAILAAFIGARLAVPVEALRVVAHHAHVAAIISGFGKLSPAVWVDDVPRVFDMSLERLPATSDLNQVTGRSAAALLLALLGRRFYDGHTAGPCGLPGGYPILARMGHVDLRLPSSLSRQAAVQLNLDAERYDGVVRDSAGSVRLHDDVLQHLHDRNSSRCSPQVLDDLVSCITPLLCLRKHLMMR